MFSNITPVGLRKFLFLFASLIFVAACSTTDKNHFGYNPEEGQFVWSEYQVENDTQYFAYRFQDHYMVAKNCVPCGIMRIDEASSVDQTVFVNKSGVALACLAYQVSLNEPWVVITHKGVQIVSTAMGLQQFPKKVTETDDGLQIEVVDQVPNILTLKK